MLIRWVPPPENAVMLNVDGSSRGNPGKAGIGGVMRDHKGEWIMGFTGFIGWTTALHAELMAIWHGLKFAYELGKKKVICQTDSLVAIALLHGVTYYPPLDILVRNIRCLVELDWEVCIQHTFREGNFVADRLAKKGSKEDNILIYLESCPREIQLQVEADANGTLYARP